MARNYGNDKKPALQAKSDAQKIAFAPIMFQAARALRNFNILNLLGGHNEGKSLQEIARYAGISEYGALVLLEAGLSLEMLRVEDDKFYLTKTGHFVNTDKLTRVNMDFSHDVNYKAFFHLEEAIKEGKPAGLHHEFGSWQTVYAALAELPNDFRKSWFSFDHYYSDTSYPEVLPLVFRNKVGRILDVGGNTGKFAIKCAEYNDNVHITILDLPGQIKEAEKNIREHNFQDRIKGHSIDLLDFSIPYPRNNDVIWMSQFLDCFSEEQILKLLHNARESMDENSELFIMETFWDKQRFDASTYSLHATSLYFTCVANGNSRMYHSEDFHRLVEQAGMHVEEMIENIGVSHTILRCKR
ncbi:MAG: methyltransferase [Bacteroidales bacterium]|nr:methyltransferase [Bacteroidales bacterium]